MYGRRLVPIKVGRKKRKQNEADKDIFRHEQQRRLSDRYNKLYKGTNTKEGIRERREGRNRTVSDEERRGNGSLIREAKQATNTGRSNSGRRDTEE